MTQEIDFKRLRKKTYLTYHQDGIIDIIIGLGILGFGIQMATENAAFTIFSWIWVFLYMPLKNRITFPRLGYVKFDDKRGTASRAIKCCCSAL